MHAVRARSCGYPTETAAVMRAYLVIGSVTSHTLDVPYDEQAGELKLDHDESAGLLTVSVSPHSALRVSVDGLDVSVAVSDEQIGQRRLPTCT